MVNCSCIFSAFCFVVSNALGIAVIVEDVLKNDAFESEREKALDADYIQSRWAHRYSIAPLIQTAHIFNAAAWLFFLTPILQLAWALSRGGKRKVGVHAAIAGFALAGCMSEVLTRLLMFGGWNAAHWISQSFTLEGWSDSDDKVGWKALEIVYIIMNGMLMWIDAFEWVCLFVVMILIYFSIGTEMPEQRSLSLWWGRLGLAIAFFSFIDLTAELLRLEDWKDFQKFGIFVAIVNTCIFLPLWLLWLACTLRNVMPTTNDDDVSPDPIWSPGVPETSSAMPSLPMPPPQSFPDQNSAVP